MPIMCVSPSTQTALNKNYIYVVYQSAFEILDVLCLLKASKNKSV